MSAYDPGRHRGVNIDFMRFCGGIVTSGNLQASNDLRFDSHLFRLASVWKLERKKTVIGDARSASHGA